MCHLCHDFYDGRKGLMRVYINPWHKTVEFSQELLDNHPSYAKFEGKVIPLTTADRRMPNTPNLKAKFEREHGNYQRQQENVSLFTVECDVCKKKCKSVRGVKQHKRKMVVMLMRASYRNLVFYSVAWNTLFLFLKSNFGLNRFNNLTILVFINMEHQNQDCHERRSLQILPKEIETKKDIECTTLPYPITTLAMTNIWRISTNPKSKEIK